MATPFVALKILITKTKNGVAIFSFENPYWVWFLIHKSVSTLL
jgi:hypothetical protein